jgi:hypothetical protein
MDKFTTGLIIVLLLFVALFGWAYISLGAGQGGAGGDSLVVRTLKAQGLENISIGGPTALGVCDGHQVPTTFTATRDSAPIAGVVCEDLVMQTAYIKYR